MRRGSAHEITILNQLRKSCIITYSSYTGPGIPKIFSEQIRSDVETIARLNLNQNISGWGTRCSTERQKMNFTLEEVANRLGTSHRAIQKQEEKDDPTTIDLFYLEAFSLLYQISPYILIDKEKPNLSAPITFFDQKTSQYYCFIMEYLYVYKDENKLKHLELITQIAKLTPAKFECLI